MYLRERLAKIQRLAKRCTRLSVPCLVTLIAMMALVGGTYAAPTQGEVLTQAAKHTTVLPMTIDCARSTSESLRELHACQFAETGWDVGFARSFGIGSNTGNCGYSQLDTESAGYPGETAFAMYLNGIGPMVAVYWGINWKNWSTNASDVRSGDQAFAPTTFWGDTVYANTGAGYVIGTFYGTVALASGAQCSIGPTAAGEQIP